MSSQNSINFGRPEVRLFGWLSIADRLVLPSNQPECSVAPMCEDSIPPCFRARGDNGQSSGGHHYEKEGRDSHDDSAGPFHRSVYRHSHSISHQLGKCGTSPSISASSSCLAILRNAWLHPSRGFRTA